METNAKSVKPKSLAQRYFEINLLYKILAGLILGAIFVAKNENKLDMSKWE